MSFGMNNSMSPAPYQGRKLGGGLKQGQLTNFTPEQMNLFKSLFSQVGPDSFTSRLAQGDEDLFNEMESPALRQFSGVQGQTASRFSGMGSGARRSSGFQNTLNSQNSDFASQLQGRRQDLQRQAIQDLMGMSKDLLHEKPYENYTYQSAPKKPSFLSRLFGGIAPIAGAGIGGLLGGPAGAAIGGRAGSSLAGIF